MLHRVFNNPWFISIASGLAVSGAVAAIVGYATRPSSTRLAGTWDVMTAQKADPVGSWKVRQVGSRVWGHGTRRTRRDGSQRPFTYRFYGRYHADQLAVVFSGRSEPHRSGCTVLRLRRGEVDRLIGVTSFWDRTPDDEVDDVGMTNCGVVSIPYELRRGGQ